MAAKGSRKNPYTWTEYNDKVTSNNWYGGWVKEGSVIIYRTQIPTITYTGRCAKSNPVPYDIYYEMAQQHTWLGGWVRNGLTKMYFDSYGTEYNNTLGTQSNPCSMYLYDEMLSNGIWEGGWVLGSNGIPHYIQAFYLNLNSGSGCGCGSSGSSGCGCGSSGSSGCGCGSSGSSGSGSGSGCGSDPVGCDCGSGGSGEGDDLPSLGYPISAGSCNAGKVYANIPEDYVLVGSLYVDWTAGNTVGQHELSAVNVSIRVEDPRFTISNNGTYTIWISPYQVAIHGTITILYNQIQHIFSIDGTFTIPEENRQ